MAGACREAGLPDALIDPFSGRPLVYTLTDGMPLVYSIGPDRADDSGAIEWNDPQQRGDVVFKPPR
jgi:hypothetical protein